MTRSRFSANASTLARPVAVKAKIDSPSADQMK
jgi:hypothetical protein